MRNKLLNQKAIATVWHNRRSKIRPPPPSSAQGVLRVSKNIAHLGPPKEGPKPQQLLSLPPFPGHPLPGRNSNSVEHVTAISWLKYYFDDILPPVIQHHFNKSLLADRCFFVTSKKMKELLFSFNRFGWNVLIQIICLKATKDKQCPQESYVQIKHSDIMEEGARVYVPVSVSESKVSKRFDVIPSGTLYPNADEIKYLQRLVKYKDSAILVLNKPPKFPVKGNLPVHNSMDALAAAALSYDYDEGPKLVHRLDRESSGLLLMGRTKESISYLHWLFSDVKKVASFSKDWSDACDAMYQRYWALVIGVPKQKEGIICAPLTKVLLNDGKTERVILTHNSGLEASQEAITRYRVLGPMINGCSWIELHPLTRRKHQLRVHCAEALGTPIVGDYKYGWFVHSRWKQMPRVDFEPTTGEPYRLRRPKGLDVQKGSVLSKVPLLHLHSREMVLPNIEKFIELHKQKTGNYHADAELWAKPDILRFVAPMPKHMKISWNLMSSYLV